MLMLISLQLGEAGTNMCCPELVPQITEKTRWQTNQCIWLWSGTVVVMKMILVT